MQKGIWFHGSGVRKFNFFSLTYSLKKIITNQYINGHNSKYTKKFTQMSMFWFYVLYLCLLNSQKTRYVQQLWEWGTTNKTNNVYCTLKEKSAWSENVAVLFQPPNDTHTLHDLVFTTHSVPLTPLLTVTFSWE